jgi:SAM-dependent methyltransferase
MKDLFSVQSGYYARYRPLYPQELYDHLYSLVNAKDEAWDAGTGNGQGARELARVFKHVTASDISEAQLQNAEQRENITYVVGGETIPSIPDKSVDLITVATAIHWFHFDRFYKEVRRVAKPGAVIAAWSYHIMQVDAHIDPLIDEYCHVKLGPYWDSERRYVEERYKTIPFPFDEITAPPFHINVAWSVDEVEGYLRSWSAVQHYIKAHGINPVEGLMLQLRGHWQGKKQVTFPVHLRVGRVNPEQ